MTTTVKTTPLPAGVFNITFEVKKIMYTNDKQKFVILKSKLLRHDSVDDMPTEITIRGKIASPFVGDVYEGEAKLLIDPVYGKYLSLHNVPKVHLPQVELHVIEFINKKVKGVGKKTAQKIVETLGADAISQIEEDYKVLYQCGINEQRSKKIQEVLVGHKKFEELVEFLQSIRLESNIASPIYNELKTTALKKVKANPYIIATIDKLTFIDADKISYELNLPSQSNERFLSAMIYYVKWRMDSLGDICVPLEEMKADFVSGEFLNQRSSYRLGNEMTESLFDFLLNDLVQDKNLLLDTSVTGKTYVYDVGYYYIEEQIIKGLVTMTEGYHMPFADSKSVDDFISSYESSSFKMAKNQKEALYMAIKNRLSVLTGGPGTGKTQTTKAIVQCIQNVKPKARIRLLAPTGKASKRMSEMTGMYATTIHRGMGMKGFGLDAELDKLEDDYIIIDESSMIDAYLFGKLITHIGEETRVLFVGDYNQLPSVGPGLVLRDLIESGKIPVTELDEVFRQAAESQINTNAHKIIAGKTTKDVDGLTFDHSKEDCYFFPRKETTVIQESIIETIRRFIDKGLYKMEEIMVLSPMRKGDLGVNELNRLIQRTFNPPTKYLDYEKKDGVIFRVKDRVMQTENDDELDVANGEIGVISSIFVRRTNGSEQTIVEVEFPDKEDPVEYTGEAIEQLLLAYAITVHKSQGSESPIVIMPIHNTLSMMLDKSIIYTGGTRAKEKLIFFGDEDLFNESVQKVNTSKRNSLIKEKIQKNIA